MLGASAMRSVGTTASDHPQRSGDLNTDYFESGPTVDNGSEHSSRNRFNAEERPVRCRKSVLEMESQAIWSSARSRRHSGKEDSDSAQSLLNESNTNAGTAPKERSINSSPPIQLPTKISLTSLAPFNYQLVLQNRILADKLLPGRSYDTHAYTPTFVHDCLMLPGSLATLLGKGSSEDLIRRMTPAVLRGFRAVVHPETLLPCLIPSDDITDFVSGMLVFGQGRRARRKVHAHYKPQSRRVKVGVEFDVVQPVLDGTDGIQLLSLERREVGANVWIWDDVESLGLQSQSRSMDWNLEDYLNASI